VPPVHRTLFASVDQLRRDCFVHYKRNTALVEAESIWFRHPVATLTDLAQRYENANRLCSMPRVGFVSAQEREADVPDGHQQYDKRLPRETEN
jgi:hypothetical protein